MTDEEGRAEYFQRRKGEPDPWAEAEISAPELGRQLGATISVRLSPDVMARLRAMANDAGVGYSRIVRRAVEQYVRPEGHVEIAIPNGWSLQGQAVSLTTNATAPEWARTQETT